MMQAAILVLALAGLVPAAASNAADDRQALPRKPDAALPGKGAMPGAGQPTNGSGRFHWYEIGEIRTLRVDPAWIADFASPPTASTRGKARTPLKRFIGGEKALESLPAGASPVFRDENGAARALAGGVVVRLRDADVPRARSHLADAGLVPVRPIDPEGRNWLVQSPPGLPSLELANQLHESGRFESATPDWWRPRALK